MVELKIVDNPDYRGIHIRSDGTVTLNIAEWKIEVSESSGIIHVYKKKGGE